MAKEPITRKSVTLPNKLWAALSEYRFTNRIGSEAAALRRLLEAALVPKSGNKK